MNELESVLANTATRRERQGLSFEDYDFVKTTLTEDFVVKDKLADHYLLCRVSVKHKDTMREEEIADSHLVPGLQVIEQKGNYFEVFPMDIRLAWAGDISSLNNKSQLHCLSILYSAIKQIVKPLVMSTLLLPQKYIIINNLWIKDTNCFLFLCNRSQKKMPFFKTQRTKSHNKRQLLKTTDIANPQANRQKVVIAKMGDLLWELFYSEKNHPGTKQKQVLHQLLKGMIKGELNIGQLQKIMESKMAKRKFLSSLGRKKIADLDDIKATVSISNEKQTIDYSTLYNKLENIPLAIGKSNKRTLFYDKKRYGNSPSIRSPAKFETLINSSDENYPPSFANKTKRKRLSLFSDSRFGSCKHRYGSFSFEKELESINHPSKTISIGGDTSQDISYERYIAFTTVSSNKAALKKEKRRILKQFFEGEEYQLSLTQPKVSKIQQKSKEKIKELTEKNNGQNQQQGTTIDDSQFLEQIKARKMEIMKQMSKRPSLISKVENQQEEDKSVNNSKVLKKKLKNSFFDEKKEELPKKILEKDYKNRPTEVKVHNEILGKVEQTEKRVEFDNYFSQSPTLIQNMMENKERETKTNLSKELIQNILPETEKSERPKQKLARPLNLTKEKSQSFSSESAQKKKSEIIQNPKDQNFEKKDKSKTIIKQDRSEEKKSEKYIKTVHFDPKLQEQKKEPLKDQIKIQKNLFQNFKGSTEHIENQFPEKKQKLQVVTQQKEEKKEDLKKQQKKQEQKAANNEKRSFYFRKQKQITSQTKQPEGVTYITRTTDPKKDDKPKEVMMTNQSQKQIPKARTPIKSQKSMKNIAEPTPHDDEIEQISFASNMLQKPTQPKKSETVVIPEQKKDNSKKQSVILPEPQKQLQQRPSSTRNIGSQNQGKKEMPKEEPTRQGNEINEETTNPRIKQERSRSQDSKGRMKTGQSNSSSTGPRGVRKQIEQYVFMINKMGQAVAKTSKISKKLEGISWYIGLYFLYKRFFHQRRKIQRYLVQQKPYLTRHQYFSPEQWREWLAKGQKEALLKKYQEDNKNILASLTKMSKKMQAMSLPANTLNNINLYKNMQQSSLIAVDHIVGQYDQLVERNMLGDPDIFSHISEMINGLLVMAEIDGKISEKKSVTEYANTRRSLSELDQVVKVIWKYYQDD